MGIGAIVTLVLQIAAPLIKWAFARAEEKKKFRSEIQKEILRYQNTIEDRRNKKDEAKRQKDALKKGK